MIDTKLVSIGTVYKHIYFKSESIHLKRKKERKKEREEE
jgi:hypothetical protein